MKIAPLFLAKRTKRAAIPVFDLDESRSVQHKYLNIECFMDYKLCLFV
jgi:hypothetical protein